VIERVLLGAAAVVIGGLALLWVHPARLEQDAQSIAQRPPQTLSRADVNHAVDLFQRAREHNPDSRPIEREAGLLIRSGRSREAISLLQPVVKREPDNLTAWALLAGVARTTHPALAREAVTRARALNPLAAQGR
jgi:predicted Zn-dependent protease